MCPQVYSFLCGPGSLLRGKAVSEKSVPSCKVEAMGGAEVGLRSRLCSLLRERRVQQEDFPQKVRGSMGPVSPPTLHWSFCRLRVSKGLIIDGCDLLAGFV